MPYQSPGAAFGSAFDNFLMQRAQQEHQQLLDSLAQKREERLVQAELDSASEHKQEMQRKLAKDQEDAHDKKVKDLEKRVSGMVAGDRPDPEMVEQAKNLGMAGIFRQQAPVMDTTPMQPPAALMEAPPTGAPAEGTATDVPAEVPGAMAPGPLVYPGSPKERADLDLKAQREAFVNSLPETMREDARIAFEAESLGMKTPTGLLGNKSAATEKTPVYRQNPRTGTIEQIGEVPKGSHFMTEPAPKDTTAHEMAMDAHLQQTKTQAFKRLNDEFGKGELAKIAVAGDIEDAIASNTTVADATLAPLILKASVTSGGNSGFRMTRPEIESVLTKPVSDKLFLALNSWTGDGPLIVTADQKEQMRKISKIILERAVNSYSKILDAEDEINMQTKDTAINDVVAKFKRGYVADRHKSSQQSQAPTTAAPSRIRYDANGMVIR